MKKINLLKPDVVTGYLSNGKGQEITCLNIDPDLTKEKLEEDIKNGADYLQEVKGLMDKKTCRVVVVKCKTREEGLLAVSYMASIYNASEGIAEDGYDFNSDNISEEKEINYEDFTEAYDQANNEKDGDDNEWEESDEWEETPWKIPIIEMGSLNSDFGMGNSPFFNGGMGFGRMTNDDSRAPYWRYTRKESICVVMEIGGPFGFCNFNSGVFKRYKSNRHIFLLIVDQNTIRKEENEDDKDFESDDCMYFDPLSSIESEVTKFVLEHSAEIVSVYHKEDDPEKYYQTLFENWVYHYGYTLSKGFSLSKISKKIAKMDNDGKSDMMDKVIRYVTKDHGGQTELTDDDFNVLYKLRGLNFKKNKEEKKHKSIYRLENSLVGMEDIKSEITSIVETFKYNRRRKAAGLKTGGYHNIHMMLGAPGTAKTTVAKLLGEIMAEEHLLGSNRFISVNGAELKGMYVGHSAPKVKSLFEDHDIIFIDEAYSVASGIDGERDSFSQEAIAQLIIELEDHGMDRLVIFAGYGGPNVSERDNKMLDFLKCNPGIRSRINSTLFFDSYNADQMVEIFRGQAKMNQYVIPKTADKYVHDFFESRVKDEDFGNGREARSLLENTAVQAARRLSDVPASKITKTMLQKITLEDVKKAIDKMKTSAIIQKGRKDNKPIGFRR